MMLSITSGQAPPSHNSGGQKYVNINSNGSTHRNGFACLGSCHRRKAARAAAFSGQQTTSVTKLLKAIEGSARGNSTSSEQKSKIMQAITELEEEGRNAVTTGPEVNAIWKLLWTTEKETLFILKNAKWFKTTASEVFQVIDTDSGSLQNVITFENGASFVVDSSLEKTGNKRLVFKFSGARLNLPSKSWNLPPFGKGWFDTTYLGDDIRVARDIRGDTLVVRRDGAPRKF